MAENTPTPSDLIDQRIAELGDWRGKVLATVRQVTLKTLPDVIEEWKWRGVPVWYDHGMLFTGESYKAIVKLTFANGAELADPKGLFNASLEGNVRRAIDIAETDKLDEKALSALILAAAERNRAKVASKKKPKA